MLRPVAFSVAVAVSLLGAGAGLIYLLLKRDDDIPCITNGQKKQRNKLELPIPKDKASTLIGRNGKNIQEMQEKTKTSIQMQDDDPNLPHRICVIRGGVAEAQAAKTQILEFLDKLPVYTSIEMWVPQGACGRIIGKSGTTIRAIIASSGAKVKVDSDSPKDGKQLVTIQGTEAQIKVAKSLVEEKVAEDAEMRRESSARTPRSPSRQTNHNQGLSTNTEHLIDAFQEGYAEAYVSAMKHPDQFWIQKLGPQSSELDRLSDTMTEFYNKEENQEIFRPKSLLEVGAMVALQYKADNKWYRGLVREVYHNNEDINETVLDVFYVDYGDDEEKKQKDVCQLKVEFLQLRHQAIECGLAGVCSVAEDGSWSEEASDLFDELSFASTWKPVMIKVQGYRTQTRGDRGMGPVPLIDIISDKDTNIAEELIEKGFAVREGAATNGQNGHANNKPVFIPAGEENWSEDDD